jgi:hypothetical protein
MAQLALALLGPFQVTLDGVPVAGFESQKVRALLTYLAIEADRPHARDALAGLLWPNQSDQDAPPTCVRPYPICARRSATSRLRYPMCRSLARQSSSTVPVTISSTSRPLWIC